MKKDKTLLILAAGMGSRFGGLKQIEPIGPNGEFIIDYSIYDAIKEGFNKVVFVIKKENFEIFKNTVGNRVSKLIKVEYAFQDINDLPDGYSVPEGREKPWGTTHAILAAKDLIHEPFAVINSDNFYGIESIHLLSKLLDKVTDREYGLVSYYLKNTLSENGTVKRGVCKIKNGYLDKLIESKIEVIDGKMMASPLDGSSKFEASEMEQVSVNLFAFSNDIFPLLEESFKSFLEDHKNNLETCESIITDIVQKLNLENTIKVMIEKTNLTFCEITYQSDLQELKNTILSKIKSGEYPNNLWKD